MCCCCSERKQIILLATEFHNTQGPECFLNENVPYGYGHHVCHVFVVTLPFPSCFFSCVYEEHCIDRSSRHPHTPPLLSLMGAVSLSPLLSMHKQFLVAQGTVGKPLIHSNLNPIRIPFFFYSLNATYVSGPKNKLPKRIVCTAYPTSLYGPVRIRVSANRFSDITPISHVCKNPLFYLRSIQFSCRK